MTTSDQLSDARIVYFRLLVHIIPRPFYYYYFSKSNQLDKRRVISYHDDPLNEPLKARPNHLDRRTSQ